ncbi:hypothetical protein BOTBODRAFT_144379 [Botryobasidium botryosum FD-172 SS1]|uniref:CFEM domain-containing protein n=1 Tax=Botryobasidium botryosum (strain FD-172 SS1) TaxID=930990 RepID=A0A067MMV3_BOTB1|nr:hypothetical protein BOTBODRAFT_144379 [Botryobasidium botryosum FD-172 SS1]
MRAATLAVFLYALSASAATTPSRRQYLPDCIERCFETTFYKCEKTHELLAECWCKGDVPEKAYQCVEKECKSPELAEAKKYVEDFCKILEPSGAPA